MLTINKARNMPSGKHLPTHCHFSWFKPRMRQDKKKGGKNCRPKTHFTELAGNIDTRITHFR